MSPRPLISLPGLLARALATLGRRPDDLPLRAALEAYFEVAGIDMAHVTRYRKLFDDPGHHVPLTYFYLLAQRAQIALMLDRRFPHAIPGLIHVRNELRLHELPESVPGLALHVSILPHQPGDDGRRITFCVDMTTGGRQLASCTSEYQTSKRPPDARTAATGPENLPDAFSTTDWIVDPAQIRRYALISGDYNPIHLSPMLARAFGFRRAIAHGMYSVGRATATIERQISRPLSAISARFQRPIQLPARLTFGFASTGETRGNYGVLLADGQRLALSGEWESASLPHRSG